MEITKQNENFTLTETTEVYEIRGSISRDSAGSLNIHFSINKLDGDYIGDAHYNSYVENDHVNFGVTCSEEIREEITACADTVIDSVIKYFKSNI